MEKVTRIVSVERAQTRSGNTRYVVRDEAGGEYTTFRPGIGEEAARHEGSRARIEFHEEERNGFHNVYLDGISAATGEDHAAGSGSDTDPDEVAWRTAVEAAPWLLGAEPKRKVAPEQLYEKLEPFKELVADDIRNPDSEEDGKS
jgi:hypothetical protein